MPDGPPDKPGYITVNLLDPTAVAAAEDAGYRLASDAHPNVVGPTILGSGGLAVFGIMSRGYQS